MNDQSDTFDQLPDAIVDRLRARDRFRSLPTPEVDRVVRRAAQAQFAPRPTRSAVRRWYVPAAAAAAAALVAILVFRPIEQNVAVDQAVMAETQLADDVDASGRVDILDVFALARARKQDPEAASLERIETLASRIVSLTPTGAAL